MDATPIFSAALARAIDENAPQIKSALSLSYHHMKASGALENGASCCFYIRHIDQIFKGGFRAGCMIEPEPIPFEHYVFMHYEWKQQPDVADGQLTKWIGLDEFDIHASKLLYKHMLAFDYEEPVHMLGDIIKPYLVGK